MGGKEEEEGKREVEGRKEETFGLAANYLSQGFFLEVAPKTLAVSTI